MRQLDGTRFDSGHKNVNEMIVASQNNARNDTDFLQWIDSSQLRILNEISQGGFGIVYEAEWFDGLIINTNDDGTIYGNRGSYQHLVAVKFFEQDKDFLKEFTNIYRMIRECSEEDKELSNIIRYYGATYDYDDQEYGIVMQYCPESSLSDYLTYNWQDVDWKKKLQILRDISYGLYTLHNQDLIHGDLHAGNVMIDDDDSLDSEIALLGDLGFCRFEEKTKKVNDVIGVIPYIAPEIFAGAPYSKKADIYSFGIIMYYVSTNVPPFHDRPHDFRLAKEIFDGLRPTVEEEIPTCFETLMRNCWNHDARSRPNAYTLYEKFHKWIDYGEEFEDMEYQVFEPIDESEFHRKAIYTSQTWRSPIINL